MTTAAPAAAFLSSAAELADLEDWGPLSEATGEPMSTWGTTLWKDGEQEVGVWECTAGPSHWVLETNEFVHVLAGRLTVTADGAASGTELGPGDTALFPRGWAGHWQLHDTVRKLYVLF
jgi:uncharacterized cupin superfamily protein